MAVTPTFFRIGMARFQMIGIGMNRMRKSVTKSNVE